MHTFIKRTFLAFAISALIFSATLSAPIAANAQAKDVPIGTLFNWHNIQQQLKDFVLKGLAWNIAKMALQQLTTSVVNWINTGFQGSPAFLTDPEGYFLDLGDQITGQMISNSGALEGLCSPWNIDVRLSLALGQTRTASERFRCTLGSIIGNARNASVNGYSIEGFTSGDFSQGGWPAFIAMTSEPQNNPYGSYLQAKSELEAQIWGKQNKVNNDLNRGQGFLSWEKCSPAVIDATGSGGAELGLDQRDLVQLNNTGNVTTERGGKYTATKDAKTGQTTYNKCSTQTPGSVISSGLNKSLGSGVDQLNLADDINEITSALFAQLMSQVLTRGLGGTTQRSGGQTQSYIDQLYSESTGKGAYTNSARSIQGEYAPYVASAEDTKNIYGKAVAAFQDARNSFSLAQGCFQDITVAATDSSDRAQAQNALNAIQNILTTQLAPAEAVYNAKYGQAVSVVDTIKSRIDATLEITDQQDVQTSVNNLQSFISTQVPIIEQGKTDAATDLTAAQAKAATFDTQAKQYIAQCQALKANPSSNRLNR